MIQKDILSKEIIDMIYEGLKKDGKIKIKGLGTFEVKHIPGRETYNPYTKGKGYMEAYLKVKFKASTKLKESLNGR